MPAVTRNHPRLRNSRAGNAFAVRTKNLMRKFEPWRKGDGVGRSTARRRSVVSTRGAIRHWFCIRRVGKSGEVRTSQALCNGIQLVVCCRRTLGTAFALGDYTMEINLTVDGTPRESKPGERLIELINRIGLK